MITLGTAWSYQDEISGEDVGHNHKLPSERFIRRLLGVDEISKSLGSALQHLLGRLPALQIILTVSPVRHTRDGLRENNLSKSALLLAASQLESTSERISYFPAYELLLDELRDYRFYADDLAHPSPSATRYIWEKLSDSYFDEKTQGRCRKISMIRSSLNHRPSHPDTLEHQAHLSRVRTQINALEEEGLDAAFLRAQLEATIS